MKKLREDKVKKELRALRMTKHFIERYFERIFNKPTPKKFHKNVYRSIYNDMTNRMLDREIRFILMFAKSSEALIPMGQYNKIVIRNNSLVTVY